MEIKYLSPIPAGLRHSLYYLVFPMALVLVQLSSLPTQMTLSTGTDIFPNYSMQYHPFAGDDKCMITVQFPAFFDLINRLSACLKDFAMSYASHRLQLNPFKSVKNTR